MKRTHTAGLCTACTVAMLAWPAHAEAVVAEAAAGGPLNASDAAPAEGQSDPVRIRVGRALDLEGAPVYSARSTFSDTAGVATFSRRPLRAPRSLALSALPSGAPLRAPISSGFGMRVHPLLGTRRLHSGIDLAAPRGSPIVATSDGTVSRAGWNGGYGLFVALEHGAGLQTRYGHMSQLAVQAGQAVRKGDIIGYVGSTGRSTGPHLHYETRINGFAVNPVSGRR